MGNGSLNGECRAREMTELLADIGVRVENGHILITILIKLWDLRSLSESIFELD